MSKAAKSCGASAFRSARALTHNRIADFGYTVFASSPAGFATFIAAYTEKWAKVIKFSGAKIY